MMADDQPARGGALKHEGEAGWHPHFLPVFGVAEGIKPAIFSAIGEGADLLWKQGNAEAAIQDEKLCNQLTKRYDVDFLCGYSLANFQERVDEAYLQRICAEHSAVCRP